MTRQLSIQYGGLMWVRGYKAWVVITGPALYSAETKGDNQGMVTANSSGICSSVCWSKGRHSPRVSRPVWVYTARGLTYRTSSDAASVITQIAGDKQNLSHTYSGDVCHWTESCLLSVLMIGNADLNMKLWGKFQTLMWKKTTTLKLKSQ
ncbi:hypothetical protein RRG08_029352 [Elysia crispata]|uniref:Uncharacterized protein n=1 Tax=Elysia crispata TaxID=231223 RepID=A0AAE1AS73_9GAST|nr:hypothetical protein RRG08_029352 [Elysia crispata]